MILDYSTARDELFAQLLTVQTETNTIIGYSPEIVFQGIERAGKMPTDKFWMRVSQQTIIEGDSALAGNDLKRRYTSDGLLFVQIFIPKDKPENYADGLKLANTIKSAYRGKSTASCIWFRNVRIQELPAEQAWFRINVVSEYQYDEIG